MPKGPVTDEHFLIVPKQHIASSLELTSVQLKDYIDQRAILTAYLNERSMDFVLFERNMPFKFQKAAHMNTQIVGLPSDTNLVDRVKKLL